MADCLDILIAGKVSIPLLNIVINLWKGVPMDAADEIRDLYRKYLDAQRTGDSEAVASLYTNDAKLIPPGQAPLTGRAEIENYYEGQGSSGVEMDLSHIEVAANLAWVTGLGHWDADGQRRHVAFLDVWRREKDGWQIAACMWNSPDGFVLA